MLEGYHVRGLVETCRDLVGPVWTTWDIFESCSVVVRVSGLRVLVRLAGTVESRV